MNGATAQDVLCIAVPEGVTVEGPIHVLYITSGEPWYSNQLSIFLQEWIEITSRCVEQCVTQICHLISHDLVEIVYMPINICKHQHCRHCSLRATLHLLQTIHLATTLCCIIL